MVHSINRDKGKRYPKVSDIVSWYTVSREIRVNSTQSLGR